MRKLLFVDDEYGEWLDILRFSQRGDKPAAVEQLEPRLFLSGSLEVTGTDPLWVTEGSPLTVTEAQPLSVEDAGYSGEEIDLTLTVSDGSLYVVLPDTSTDSGVSVDIIGTLTEVNTALETLTYTPDGTPDDIVDLDYDLTNDRSGGPDTDSGTIVINVDDQNDAPAITAPATSHIYSGQILDLDSAYGKGVSIVDADSSGAVYDATLTISDGTVWVSTAGGAAASGSTTSVYVISGSLTEVNAALATLEFDPDSGVTSAGFNLEVDNSYPGDSSSNVQVDTDVAVVIHSISDMPATWVVPSSVKVLDWSTGDPAFVFSAANNEGVWIDDGLSADAMYSLALVSD